MSKPVWGAAPPRAYDPATLERVVTALYGNRTLHVAFADGILKGAFARWLSSGIPKYAIQSSTVSNSM